jgi:dimethylargininase
MQQHAAYEEALEKAGLAILRLPELPAHPDGVFVEDTALLLDGHAVITRPGAPSRSGETESTAAALSGHFEVLRLEDGHLDGGDVLRIDRTLYVGISSRTDRNGFDALGKVAGRLGWHVVAVSVRNCLHLKTAATFLGPDASGTPVLLFNPSWVDASVFSHVDMFEVDKDEPVAANVLRARDSLIAPAGNGRTIGRLRARGFTVQEVDISELEKAEAGVTCMSLIPGNSR